MNDRLHTSARLPLFAGLPHSPQQHFALLFFAALLRLARHAAERCGGVAPAVERFPFLGAYLDEIAALGLDGEAFAAAQSRWAAALADWEAAATQHLPLAALRGAAGLEDEDLVLLCAAAFADEDPRLGELCATLAGSAAASGLTAPLAGMLWPPAAGFDARAALGRLEALGLLARATDAPAWHIPPDLAPLLRGAPAAALPWLHHVALAQAPALDDLLLPDSVRAQAGTLAAALAAGDVDTIALRGPLHNGRRTLAAAIARAAGLGTVRVVGCAGADDPRWRTAAIVAALTDAALVVAADTAPSEAFALPDLPPALAPLLVVLGTGGALAGARTARCASLSLPVPDAALRRALWRAQPGVDEGDEAQLQALAHRRLTTGGIVRAAQLARGTGAVVTAAGVREALRSSEHAGLAALARRVPVETTPPPLALAPQTAEDLRLLAARCRHREQLGPHAGAALQGLGCGVRVLFKGPSGTGKTLAARHLAATLGMELYRVDLSAVVNKYIGETEKNLERVFAQAEALDVVLLLDEGDALLSQRTAVGNATDRYANLETNFLLQRLENYEGVLVITTNAADRIDGAFLRRLDLVMDFPAPEATERWNLWQMHLPPLHAVDPARLQAVAQRCVLSGGQVRNVALHATLLALESGRALAAEHLEAALEREYRKQGSASPLRAR